MHVYVYKEGPHLGEGSRVRAEGEGWVGSGLRSESSCVPQKVSPWITHTRMKGEGVADVHR